jgi:putative transposase
MSMSRRGDCWDNAVAESNFSSLKMEYGEVEMKPSWQQARTAIVGYVVWFNFTRLYFTLDYRSPDEYESLTYVTRLCA